MPKTEFETDIFDLLDSLPRKFKKLNVTQLELVKEDLDRLSELADKEIEEITSMKRLIKAVADH